MSDKKDAEALHLEAQQTPTNPEKVHLSDQARDDVDLKGVETGDLDYSGASTKIDPVEIALVKKLDMFIMPT